eukprot:10070558-Ditylum_brightwellii.AAC.1
MSPEQEQFVALRSTVEKLKDDNLSLATSFKKKTKKGDGRKKGQGQRKRKRESQARQGGLYQMLRSVLTIAWTLEL